MVVTDPALAPILRADDKFEVHTADEPEARYIFEQGGFDILIIGNKVIHRNSEKSIAAFDALDKAIQRYDEARLLEYNDLNDTFPVWITVKNIAREEVFQPPSIQKLPEVEKTAGQTPAIEAVSQPSEEARVPSRQELADIGAVPTLKERELATPSHFAPPIPFKSVALSFLFIFPIYFIAQFFLIMYNGRKGEAKGGALACIACQTIRDRSRDELADIGRKLDIGNELLKNLPEIKTILGSLL